MADFTIRHVIECSDLIGAITRLADAVSGCAGLVIGACPIPGSTDREEPAEAPQRNEQTLSPETSVDVQKVEPDSVQDPSVSFQSITEAGSALLEAGRMDDLMALLDRLGVKALTQLTSDQYPAVAEGLRALGAKI